MKQWILRWVAVVASFTVVAMAARASVVLSYGPDADYLLSGTTQTFSNSDLADFTTTGTGAPGDPYVTTRAFSDTGIMNPPSNVYSGPVFYGGFSVAGTVINPDPNLANTSLNRYVRTVSTRDNIMLQPWRNGNIGGWDKDFVGEDLVPHNGVYDLAMVVLFQQEDFASPFDSGPLTLTRLQAQYTVSGSAGSGFSSASRSRWLIEKDGVYYLSEILSASGGGKTFDHDAVALIGYEWTVYDPTSSIFMSASPSYGFLSDLDNVTAAGLYLDAYEFAPPPSETKEEAETRDPGTTYTHGTGGVLAEYQIRTFTVEAIPEPSGLLLMGVATGLLLGVRRRVRRRIA